MLLLVSLGRTKQRRSVQVRAVHFVGLASPMPVRVCLSLDQVQIYSKSSRIVSYSFVPIEVNLLHETNSKTNKTPIRRSRTLGTDQTTPRRLDITLMELQYIAIH